MFKGMHHLHKRKRIFLKHEKYPSPDKWKRAMDKIIYVVGIAGPFVVVPQILKIWTEKNAGVSQFSHGQCCQCLQFSG